MRTANVGQGAEGPQILLLSMSSPRVGVAVLLFIALAYGVVVEVAAVYYTWFCCNMASSRSAIRVLHKRTRIKHFQRAGCRRGIARRSRGLMGELT